MNPKYKHLQKLILKDFEQVQTKKIQWGEYKGVSISWVLWIKPTYVKWMIDEGLIVGNEKVIRWLYEKAWKKCPDWSKDKFCKYPDLRLDDYEW